MILVLDNYDSFVHNLARYVRCQGCPTRVVRSDQISVDECSRLSPSGIVISPGPGRPERAGCSVEVVRTLGPQIPILGVCLGHQSIGSAFGADIRCCDPVHGMASQVRHDGRDLFDGCPNPILVGRYHSLAIEESTLPDSLIVTARSEDGIVMGIRHDRWPIYGVQFHPESVLSECGAKIIENFVSLVSQSVTVSGEHSK